MIGAPREPFQALSTAERPALLLINSCKEIQLAAEDWGRQVQVLLLGRDLHKGKWKNLGLGKSESIYTLAKRANGRLSTMPFLWIADEIGRWRMAMSSLPYKLDFPRHLLEANIPSFFLRRHERLQLQILLHYK